MRSNVLLVFNQIILCATSLSYVLLVFNKIILCATRLSYVLLAINHIVLWTDYAPGSDLFNSVDFTALDETGIRFYLSELVVALQAVHEVAVLFTLLHLTPPPHPHPPAHVSTYRYSCSH